MVLAILSSIKRQGMMRYLLLIVFGLMFQKSFGQQPDSTYHLGFTGTGNLNKTNTGTSYIFNNALRASYSKNIFNLNSFFSWIYGENPDKKTNNDFLAVVDFDFFKKNHKWYYWGLTGYEKSFSLKIQNRFQAGGGLGYNLLDKQNALIVLTDGLLYEKSELREVDIYNRFRYETLRNSFRLKYKFTINEIIVIEGSHYLQNSFSDGQDYIIRSNSHIGFKLTKWLNINTGLVYNKLNLTNKSNLLFTYGISIEKYL
jgi:Protein of unknown function, DUF481